MKYSMAFKLTKYLRKEEEYVPWEAVTTNVNTIKSILPRSSPSFKYLEVC